MYRARLQKDLDLWVGKGLIARPQADSLIAEFDSRRSAFSIAGVLMILAAVLLSASILLLIAAGWQEIPRLVKIAGIFALIWLFHLSAALAEARGASRLAGALLVLGSASFGGAIALVGQQYHLSGDTVDAMMLWFALTAVSAALFRSGALTFACGLLAWAGFASFLEQYGGDWEPVHAAMVVGAGLVVLVLSWWTQAHRAQHFVYTLALGFIFWLYTLNDEPAVALALAVAGVVLFGAAAARPAPWAALARAAGAAPAFYALALALMGLGLLHFDYDTGAAMALLALATVALCILALALAGRDNGAVRFLAYAAFAGEVLYLSFVTIDSMLGTSGFFLLSGFVVAIVAFVVIRMEKLFAARAAREAS